MSSTPTNAALRRTELAITGMTCGHCVRHVDAALRGLPGVVSVEVRLGEGGRGSASVTHDASVSPLAALAAAVESEGYTAVAA